MGDRLQEMYRDFELCTRCGELRGAVEWTDGRAQRRLLQECACQRALRSDVIPRWWGFDCNVVAELCRVCESAVLPSGTRFAPPICDDCRDRGLRLRRADDAEGQRLEEWSRDALTRNLVDAGLAHRSVVPLADYLEVVELVDREQRVEECITFLHLGTVSDSPITRAGPAERSGPQALGWIPVGPKLEPGAPPRSAAIGSRRSST